MNQAKHRMLIQVLAESQTEKGLIIDFLCDAGTGRGIWSSTTLTAKLKENYSAEIDVRSFQVLKCSSVGVSLIENDKRINYMSGAIEGVDTDGIAIMRLAKDCIISLDQSNENRTALKTGLWAEIAVNIEDLIVTPFGRSTYDTRKPE